ncbi:NAD(P)-dependent oxidoreductase [Microbacterium sp. NPDC056234]|uniref:NAD(P)-dependent oxidoreductase n=1 Tax=Microbacterium sp. NPDC056234 TaxID=3345757 RepID=UPI0035DE94C1
MTAPFRVLAAGDRFIRAGLFRSELEDRLGDRVAVEELEFEWPDAPFGAVGEVDEASGDEDSLIAALAGKQAIVTQLAPLTERVLRESPDLRIIGVSRGGPTNVNVDAATRFGIQVVNVPGRNGIATAEMTLGLILAVTRRIPQTHQTLAAHEWHGEFYRADEVGMEIAGSTVGLLGAGAVGGHVATVLHAMGAEVLVFDPYLPAGRLDGIITRIDDIDELFRRSNLISVHARLTPETRHAVSAERLAMMPSGGFLVNAARGGLVDYDAVADAVDSRHLAGAAFDVFPTEPVDFGHRLFTLLAEGANIVMTPHIAGASRQTAIRAAAGVAEEVARHIDGAAPLHPLNTVGQEIAAR